MAPTSKTVLGRSRRSLALESSLEHHGEELARRLTEELGPHLRPGETMPDLRQTLDLFRRSLAARHQELWAAEESHAAEMDDDLGPRRRRDRGVTALRQRLLAVREATAAYLGRKRAAAVLGLHGRTGRDAQTLLNQGERVLRRLTDPQAALPQPEMRGLGIEYETVAEQVRELTEPLRRAYEDLLRESRELERTQGARQLALRAFDRAVGALYGLTRSLYHFTGLDHLADLLGPAHARNVRRGGRHGPRGGEGAGRGPETARPTSGPGPGAPGGR